MKILFLGPPGSGKGTQAKILADELGIEFVSMGDIVRDEIEKETIAGLEAKKYVIKGQLVPDDVVIKMLVENLPDSFVLDGFPRNLSQAVLFERIQPDLVFLLTIDIDQAIERITQRRVCPICKRVYNLLTDRPRREGVCDECGARLTIREDDREATVRKRMTVYEKETYPLVEYYRRRGLLIEIDGKGSIEEVHNRVRKVFSRKKLKDIL